MAFLRKIFRRGKRQPKTIELDRFLKMRPLRNPHLTWKKTEDGKVVIPALVAKKGRRRKRKSDSPKEIRIELDKIGSFLWDKLDGQHTTEDILKEVQNKFRIIRQEAELSLFRYFQDLVSRGLIGFALPSTPEE